MCIIDIIGVKTLCKIFAVLNVLFGLLAICYWEVMMSLTDGVIHSSSWDSVLTLNEDMRQTIAQKCGPDYLTRILPVTFGNKFRTAIHVYNAASVIFCIKGLIQFFITCLSPKLTRGFALGILLVDTTNVLLVLLGLHLYKCDELCLIEHFPVLGGPYQQTQMTLGTTSFIFIFKTLEIIVLIFLILEQNKRILTGEIASKGVRRSEAFRTPMVSRASSIISRDQCSDRQENNGNNNPSGMNRYHVNLKMAFQQLKSADTNSFREEDEEADKAFTSQENTQYAVSNELVYIEGNPSSKDESSVPSNQGDSQEAQQRDNTCPEANEQIVANDNPTSSAT